MNLLNLMRISGSALTAQRLRMDVLASNIANAETTRTAGGGPYRRQQVVFQPFTVDLADDGDASPQAAGPAAGQGLQVSRIIEDQGDGRMVFDPDHPDANEQGYVTYPEIDIAVEMTDMISATRAYEASVTVLQAIKTMVQRTLDIGR